MKSRDLLIALSCRYQGDAKKIRDAIVRKEMLEEEEIESALASVKSKTVTILDEDYPKSLLRMPSPPFVLYYYGDLSLLEDSKRIVAYIGSRDASEYGLDCADYFTRAFVKAGAIIITGIARGIDARASKAALDEHGLTIAVLGSGIDFPYPSTSVPLYEQIRRYGLVLSEYPGRTSPTPYRFPMRNRIIAGLASLVVVGEASYHSGTLVTAAYALATGKDVACIPFPARQESACNGLLRDGAFLLDSEKDILPFVSDWKTLTKKEPDNL